MRRSPACFLLALLVLAGCDKKADDGGKKADESAAKTAASDEGGKPAKKASGDDDKKAAKADDDKKPAKADDDGKKKPAKGDDDAAAGRKIGGVDVPAWKKPVAAKGACKLTAAQTKQLEALSKGEGDGFDDGTVDFAKLLDGLKEKCPSAGAKLSMALNAGGYTRYAKKKWSTADQWWTRALIADPTNTFARYNLACGLALDGKPDDAVWNVRQLVLGAEGDDPRALHYLRKAKSDEDLDSVRKNDDFKTAIKRGEELLGSECTGKTVPGTTDKGKKTCIQICNAYGAGGGCEDGKGCYGSASYGDGLVPYCKAKPAEKCNAGETMLPTREVSEGVWEASCQKLCRSDDDCSPRQHCESEHAYLPMAGGGAGDVDVCWPRRK